MASNLNASAFVSETQNDYASKVIAELYMQNISVCSRRFYYTS